MKSKFFFSALTVILAGACLTACSGNTSSDIEIMADNDVSIAVQEESDTAKEYSTEIQENDDWRFQYDEELGGIKIIKCLCADSRGKEHIQTADKDIVVPDTFEGFEGLKVLEIGSNSFKSLVCKSVTLPDGLIYIDRNAFEDATISDTFVIPDTVTYIGAEAFMYYRGTSVVLPPMETIGDRMFLSSDVQSITISEGTKIIGTCAFYNCSELAEITIADTVEEIDPSAFYACEKIESLRLPDSLKKVELMRFQRTFKGYPVIEFKGTTYDFPSFSQSSQEYKDLEAELNSAIASNS